MEWINDVLEVLSHCVLTFGGVLVDYIGDELMAMFGAPVEYADHSQRACSAALAMLDSLPKLQERWIQVTQLPMGVGIGINSGTARVGNVGSAVKFKYGPLGNTVNLASRVQGASKYLKATVLITEATHARLDQSFTTRRLCQVRVVNIDKPVTLFEMLGQPPADWLDLKTGYEEALDQFEKKELHQTANFSANCCLSIPTTAPSRPFCPGPSIVCARIPINSILSGNCRGSERNNPVG